jgi:hypothetical protein
MPAMDSTPTAPGPASMLRNIDGILRGQFTSPDALASGRVEIATRELVRLGLVLGMVYGLGLGSYAVSHGGPQPVLQLLSSAVKLPLLFLLTLAVTFPSLYVFATLLRSPLGRLATLRLLLVAIVVDLAVLASLGPVFAFFAVSTESYPFLLLLHVLFAGAGGVISLLVLARAADVLFAAAPEQRRASRRLLLVWCVVYGTVGAQMGWLLRPFLGAPGQPFELLRARGSSFFEAVLHTLRELLTR